LSNQVPDVNRLVSEKRWREAAAILMQTNNFPEFTGRVCPALCEASCVLDINDEPVSIRAIEQAVIEKAFDCGLMDSADAPGSTDRQIAVIGSGPAGLTVADMLTRQGFAVTVFEKASRPGGILRYGIPDFKLPKNIIDRRLDLMRKQGVRFETEAEVGSDISADWLLKRYDAICLAAGSRKPRDLTIPGRELAGVHFAMDYLTAQNQALENQAPEAVSLNAQGKHVIVIGGGDTGADCVGTAIRQGAKSLTQLEIMPEPPRQRSAGDPWPGWPRIRRDSSSHKEGGSRMWSVNTREFKGSGGRIAGIKANLVRWETDSSGRWQFADVPGTGFELEADLVLLALGFSGPSCRGVADQLNLKMDEQNRIEVEKNSATSSPKVFAVGDLARGQSLVVRAMADSRRAAEAIARRLG
jgi:glutamate synthase (NADPH/NADH) small chain